LAGQLGRVHQPQRVVAHPLRVRVLFQGVRCQRARRRAGDEEERYEQRTPEGVRGYSSCHPALPRLELDQPGARNASPLPPRGQPPRVASSRRRLAREISTEVYATAGWLDALWAKAPPECAILVPPGEAPAGTRVGLHALGQPRPTG